MPVCIYTMNFFIPFSYIPQNMDGPAKLNNIIIPGKIPYINIIIIFFIKHCYEQLINNVGFARFYRKRRMFFILTIR